MHSRIEKYQQIFEQYTVFEWYSTRTGFYSSIFLLKPALIPFYFDRFGHPRRHQYHLRHRLRPTFQQGFLSNLQLLPQMVVREMLTEWHGRNMQHSPPVTRGKMIEPTSPILPQSVTAGFMR